MPRRHVEAGGGNASRTRNVRRSWRGGGGVGMVGVKGREALWVGTDSPLSPLGGFRRRRRRRRWLVADVFDYVAVVVVGSLGFL